jgi:hypothetical protein
MILQNFKHNDAKYLSNMVISSLLVDTELNFRDKGNRLCL